MQIIIRHEIDTEKDYCGIRCDNSYMKSCRNLETDDRSGNYFCWLFHKDINIVKCKPWGEDKEYITKPKRCKECMAAETDAKEKE